MMLHFEINKMFYFLQFLDDLICVYLKGERKINQPHNNHITKGSILTSL